MKTNAKPKKSFSKKKNCNREQETYSKGKSYNSKYDAEISDKRSGGRDNDISWYTRYPGIYSATSNLSFNNPAGIKLNLADANDQPYDVAGNGIYLPTALGLRFVMCPGISNGGSSLINTAMFQNYNFVRHANSGSKNYDAVDLQMYFLAVDTAYTWYMYGCRAYGLLGRFSALNRAVPRSLFAVMGLDYDSWAADPAQLRARLNLVAAKLSSLKVPAGNTMLARHLYLTSCVFMDGETEKAQAYVFSPAGYHTWGRSNKVGTLTYHGTTNTDMKTQLTPDAYFTIMDDMCKPLLEDEDINIMSGDVLKAYGDSACTRITMMDEGFTTPLYPLASVPALMSQIENCMPANFEPNSTFDITQTTDGHIFFQPNTKVSTLRAEAKLGSIACLLNHRSAEVTNEDVIEMTRLRPTFSSHFAAEVDQIEVSMRSCGTEFINNLIIASRNDEGVTLNLAGNVIPNLNDVVIPQLMLFDWAPLIYVAAALNVGDKVQFRVSHIIGDLANYTVVSKITLDNIHDTCVASQLLIDTTSK